MQIGGKLLINSVTIPRFHANRRRSQGEANPHIHHPFRSRWSLKFPQLPTSHLTGNISVQFPAPRNRWSFARAEPRESADKAPGHSSPREAQRWGFTKLSAQGYRAENGNLTSSRSWSCYRRVPGTGAQRPGKVFTALFFKRVFRHRPNHHAKPQMLREGKLRHWCSEIRQKCNVPKTTWEVASMPPSTPPPPRWESVLGEPERSAPRGKVTAPTRCQTGVRHGRRARSFLPSREAGGQRRGRDAGVWGRAAHSPSLPYCLPLFAPILPPSCPPSPRTLHRWGAPPARSARGKPARRGR